MSSYTKGYRFEKRVQKYFEKEGWVVFRQGKSSFPDLIAIKKGVFCFIECKYSKKGKGYLSKEEVTRGREIAIKTGGKFIKATNEKRKILLEEL